MTRYIYAIVFSVITTTTFGQIKLLPKNFENGYKYPHVVLASNQSHEDSINKRIQERIADLKASDFCIGEYGYVQKGSHIEIHLVCNCIDMSESEHRYIFFNIETGENATRSDLFADKEQDKALILVRKKIAGYKANDAGCSDDFKKIPEDASYADFDIRLYKDGIEIRPKDSKNCNSNTLRISWIELSSHLRYNFI